MATNQRPNVRRGPSGAWGRLKTGPVDPLESYGLPSKGETRLNDSKAQENYYNKIVERYMKFCADSGGGDQLDKQLASLSLVATADATPPQSSTKAPYRPGQPLYSRSGDASRAPKDPTVELSTILAAMRKLRESIVATHRHDTFAQRAYIFIIRAAILTKHMETYHPALLYLLHNIHPKTPLPSSELHEFVGYQILDLACRQSDLGKAYSVKVAYSYTDMRVENVLHALAHDNWFKFWKLRRAVDGYQKRLLEWAEDDVRVHALKALGRTYMSVDKSYVEKSTGAPWSILVENGVGWELQEGDRVIIRRPKAK